MESDVIIEKSPSAWLCIVAKADGSPRFWVDYRKTINKFLVRETWLRPHIESHIEIIGGAEFITVCDVQTAYWKMPIAKNDLSQTVFVTSKGKYVFNGAPRVWAEKNIFWAQNTDETAT